LNPSQEFIIDHTKTAEGSIYVAEEGKGTIWMVDGEGCRCQKVVDADGSPSGQSLGLPPDSMTVDQERLYWSNENQKVLLSIEKNATGAEPRVEATQTDISQVMTYGNHVQPMPGKPFLCNRLPFYEPFICRSFMLAGHFVH
jgi:hypothetical protein